MPDPEIKLSEAQEIVLVKLWREEPIVTGFVDENWHDRFVAHVIDPLRGLGVIEFDIESTKLTPLGVRIAERILERNKQ